MQALLFVSMFGMFFAVVFGLVGSLSMSSMSLKDRQIEDTKQFMRDLASYFENDVAQRKVFIPRLVNAENYIDTYDVRQNVNWLWDDDATGFITDPWGQQFRLEAAIEDHPITAGTVAGQANIVQPQALAIVIASAGPDQQFSSGLATALNTISSSGNPTINSIMNVEADANSDDIVFTFNTRRALERRWEQIETSLNSIAGAYARRFQQDQYRTNFQQQVEAYYEYAYANGRFSEISGNLEAWKNPGAWYPNNTNVSGVAAGRTSLLAVAPDFANYQSQIQGMRAQDDEHIRIIRYNGGESGERNTSFSITATADKTVAANAVNDVLRLQLNPQGTSAWRNRANQFRFRVEVGR